VTNAVAIIGLTYDGTDIQAADFGVFLELVRGLNEPPAVRGVDLIVPSRAGRIVRNREADALTIELRGYVMGSGSTEALQRISFRTNAKIVRALFDTSAEPADLVASLEDSTTATISARTLNSIWDQTDPWTAAVSIELESVDPEWVVA
jgi:hypothetical protein